MENGIILTITRRACLMTNQIQQYQFNPSPKKGFQLLTCRITRREEKENTISKKKDTSARIPTRSEKKKSCDGGWSRIGEALLLLLSPLSLVC